MREIIRATANFTKKDMINSRSAIPLQSLQDGETLRVERAAMIKATDTADGEERNTIALRTDKGLYYTGISATIYEAMNDVIDLIEADGDVSLMFNWRTSNNGRKFLTLIIE